MYRRGDYKKSTTWKVKIPSGRWMAGMHSFKTKREAMEFVWRWNDAERKSGARQVGFKQVGKTFEPNPLDLVVHGG